MLSCPECSRELKNVSGLKGHMRMVHGAPAEGNSGEHQSGVKEKAMPPEPCPTCLEHAKAREAQAVELAQLRTKAGEHHSFDPDCPNCKSALETHIATHLKAAFADREAVRVAADTLGLLPHFIEINGQRIALGEPAHA